MRPRIAFVLGDPNGIGPEIAVKVLARAENAQRADVVVFTDPAILEAGERVAGVRVARNPAGGPAPAIASLSLLDGQALTAGEATSSGGRAGLSALTVAAEEARVGRIDGIVFAPLNKHALRLAGLAQEDELRYLQTFFGVEGFVSEFNITGDLWTSRVTSHIPLKDVPAALSVEGIVQAVRIVDRYLRASGKAAPRIAVAALNPHAGDGGSLGREEIELIAPAVALARDGGIAAHGPLPADTVFVAARRGDYDAVVSMYHDQGQIAMKLIGFDRGVTLHGGLPVPVATCASGTAFDIVGRNVANPEGLQAAFDLAVRIAAAQQ
ncbi:MAG TPA: 4-hydroxythreonine-4-phosphate dehydrogenase PdxA [Casimicrobiaceae bacterium]|jgi:4-hydroxythreonine-4-phosphate dehydrogenase